MLLENTCSVFFFGSVVSSAEGKSQVAFAPAGRKNLLLLLFDCCKKFVPSPPPVPSQGGQTVAHKAYGAL